MGFEAVHDGGQEVTRSHGYVRDAEVEEHLGGVGLPLIEPDSYPLQVFSQRGITECEIRWSTANGLVK